VTISYDQEPGLAPEAFIDILERSGLGLRRPIDDPDRVARMLRQADIVLCARAEGRLVGVARSIRDFSYCTYLSDLAVDHAFQRGGIGRELIRRTHEIAGHRTSLLLVSAPDAMGYYRRIGMAPIETGWKMDRTG
jgi:GNAT superfamily N-acetyltransferase